METNCLSKKLKVSVDNENLRKLGEIEISVVDANNFTFTTGYANTTIRTTDTVLYYLDNNGSKVGQPFKEGPIDDGVYNKGVGVDSNYNGKVFFDSKYQVRDMTFSGGIANFEPLLQCNSITIKHGNTYIKDIKYPKVPYLFYFDGVYTNSAQVELDEFAAIYDPYVTRIDFKGSNGYIVIRNAENIISNKPNVTRLEFYKTTLRGLSDEKMADFGKMPLLTKISHINTLSWTVENFVKNKRSVGVTTGEVNIIYGGDSAGGGICSFNGQKLDSSVTLVTWTATTITYNGVTINA